MNNQSKRKSIDKKSFGMRVETILAIFIAICVVALMFIDDSTQKKSLQRYNETLFISEELINSDDAELQELILNYDANPYKMIEIYDEEFNLTFRIQFDKNNIMKHEDIMNHHELLEYLKNTPEGHTNFITDNDETDLYFQWTTLENRTDKQLVLIYTTRQKESSPWLFDLICYIILITAFVIVIFALLLRNEDKIREAKNNMEHIFRHM